MARPSLTSSPAGLAVAKQALVQKGTTQVELGQKLQCSRQPISNFFGGKAIEQRLFIAICNYLDLDWHEIAGIIPIAAPQSNQSIVLSSFVSPPIAATRIAGSPLVQRQQIARSEAGDIQTLVRHCRDRVQAEIGRRCGPIRILGLNHPIDLEDIYTHVQVLEKISAYRWQTVDDLMAETKTDAERWSLGRVNPTRISGVEALNTYQRLILLGKPGAGKSTFLHHLAAECNRGELAADRVPILLTLKDWVQTDVDLSLIDYIDRSYKSAIDSAELTQVLQAGRGLILLDGLDEIPNLQAGKMLDRLREFIREFGDNQIVVSCRIAAWEDTYGFERFAEVELADFDDEQIAVFTQQWFKAKPELATKFRQELEWNPELKELVATPILLSLVCLAFEDLGTCPQTRAKLYQVGIEILLTKWDDRRGIDRVPVYKWLSTELKVRLLAKIAFETFQDRQYFFTAAVVERYILEFLAVEIPTLKPSKIDARSILRSIAIQHGLLVERARDIYSFSHLTFQEYFVARYLIPTPNQVPARSIEILIDRLADGSTWREVWLLAVELLIDGDLLLAPLQANIQHLVSSDPPLGKYLRDEIPHFVPEIDKIQPKLSPQACLALRFDLDFDLDHNRTVAFALDRRCSIFVVASFYLRMLKMKMKLTTAIEKAESDLQKSSVKTANEAMEIAIENVWKERENLPVEIRRKLEDLTTEYAGGNDKNKLAVDARELACNTYRLGDFDRKSADFKTIARKYYYRVGIIVECLQNRDCQISPQRRQALLDSLFVNQPPAIVQPTGAGKLFASSN